MLIQFYRFKDWYKSLGIFLVGLTLNPNILSLFSLIVPILIAAHIFSINNYFDFFIKKEKNIMKDLYKKYSKRFLFFLCILPLFFLFLYPYSNLKVIFLVILLIVLADLYSCPPTRFKKNGILGLVINPICGAILFLIGYFQNNKFLTQESIFLSIVFLNYVMLNEILHQLSDPNEVSNSLPKILGFKKTVKLTKIIILITLFIGIIYSFILYLPYSFISITFSLLRLRRLSKTKNYKWLRNHLFGLHEGIFYLILNLLWVI